MVHLIGFHIGTDMFIPYGSEPQGMPLGDIDAHIRKDGTFEVILGAEQSAKTVSMYQ